MFDSHAVRADFPILKRKVNDHPLIYFDNAATTQKPTAVIERLNYFYRHENSNIHRAAHALAAKATDATATKSRATRKEKVNLRNIGYSPFRMVIPTPGPPGRRR